VSARGSKGGFSLAEIKLDENNYLVVELYTPTKGRDEGHQVANIRVFTKKLYDTEKGKKVYLPEAEVRDDPKWIPAGGYMIREGQAPTVLPALVEALEKVMKLWGVERSNKGAEGIARALTVIERKPRR
jgi:hypothetical protein